MGPRDDTSVCVPGWCSRYLVEEARKGNQKAIKLINLIRVKYPEHVKDMNKAEKGGFIAKSIFNETFPAAPVVETPVEAAKTETTEAPK